MLCLGITREHPVPRLPALYGNHTLGCFFQGPWLLLAGFLTRLSHSFLLQGSPIGSSGLISPFFHSPLSLLSFLLCRKETNNLFPWTPVPSGSDLPPWAAYQGILQDGGNFLFRDRFWNEQLGKFIIHFVTPITKRSLPAFFFKVAFLFICAVYGFFRITYTGNTEVEFPHLLCLLWCLSFLDLQPPRHPKDTNFFWSETADSSPLPDRTSERWLSEKRAR